MDGILVSDRTEPGQYASRAQSQPRVGIAVHILDSIFVHDQFEKRGRHRAHRCGRHGLPILSVAIETNNGPQDHGGWKRVVWSRGTVNDSS
jgi:hypothetical protein